METFQNSRSATLRSSERILNRIDEHWPGKITAKKPKTALRSCGRTGGVPRGLETPRFRIAGYTICEPLKRQATLRRPGSLYPSQRSQGTHSGDGVQDLDARIVVAVERRHCARTPSRDRVCRVGKPYPEVEQVDRDRREAAFPPMRGGLISARSRNR